MLFRCTRCGATYNGPVSRCARCGGVVRAVYTWRGTLGGRPARGIWFFQDQLPAVERHVSLGEALTPLIESRRRRGLYYKNEGLNPTGSFRDRVAAVLVSHALSSGYNELAAASDGNMGVSLAAYAARAGVSATVYTPRWIDPEKAMLMKAFGADLRVIDGGLEEAIAEARRYAEEKNAYNATSHDNPLSIEALKTIAFEIYLDLGRAPEYIVVPLGSGLTMYSIYTGFEELIGHGLVEKHPVYIGVESCGNPAYTGQRRCREKPLHGLAYRDPPFRGEVLDIIRGTRGFIVTVSRKESIEAAKNLARNEGLFVEVSSATAAAALEKSSVELGGPVVVLLTGHGLKAPEPYVSGSRRRTVTVFPGPTKLQILRLLASTPGLTGYDVWKRLGLNITPQAVYQHLRELMRQGYLEVRRENNVKKYYVTEKGRRVLIG